MSVASNLRIDSTRPERFKSGLLHKAVLSVIAFAGMSSVVGIGVSMRLAKSASSNSGEILGWLPWILLLGAGSYLLRFLRWHGLVRQLAPQLRVRPSLRIYMAGFAMGLTPGRVGEFCKFALLRQETMVPEARSAPIFPLERATEAASFAALATTAAVAGHLQPARLGVSTVAAIAALPGLALLALVLHFLAGRVAIGQNSTSPLDQLTRGVRSVAGPWPATQALLCAVGARCCDAMLLWSAVRAAGLNLSVPASALAFGVAGLTGGFSLLPAGVGAVEASLVASISGLNGSPAAALMAALLTRFATLWIWIPGGLWFAWRARLIGVSQRPTAGSTPQPLGVPASARSAPQRVAPQLAAMPRTTR